MQNYADFDPAFLPIKDVCQPHTMTSVERLYALYKALEYVSAANIQGHIVECGVWRGGSIMCAALTLLKCGDTSRSLYLYDTFEGMVPPAEVDVSFECQAASTLLAQEARAQDSYIWAYAPLELVRQNLAATGYPDDQIHYIQGTVEETIPANMPDEVALLRLDTDWYSSTKHSLQHLFPRLAKGGVLIIDDYGHWRGAKQAVDEYLRDNEIRILLNRIDYTGRIGVR